MSDDFPREDGNPAGAQPAGGEDDHQHLQRLIDLTWQQFETGQEEEASKSISALLAANPQHPEVCFLAGLLQMRKGHLDKAAIWFERAVTRDQSVPRYHEALINTYIQASRPEDAIQALLSAARSSSDPLRFYRRLEALYVERNDANGLSSLINEVRARYVGKPELSYVLGEAAFSISHHALAIDYFRQCYDKEYVEGSRDFYLASSFVYFGYYDFALGFFRLVLRNNRRHLNALSGLRDLLLWRLRSGNEQLLSAVELRCAEEASRLGPVAQLQYLGLKNAQTSQLLDDWIDQKDVEFEPYVCFCEFYKDQLRKNPTETKNWYDPANSLLACIAHLAFKKDETLFLYYRAWHSFLTGDKDSARTALSLLVSKDDLPIWIKDGCEEVLDEIGPPADSKSQKSEKKQEPTEAKQESTGGKAKRQQDRSIKALEGFGLDLSALVSADSAADLSGVDSTVNRICEALASDSGRGVVLVGPSGVGKTAAIRRLASFLKSDKAPKALRDFSVFQTSTTSLLAGAKYIGTWQENLEKLCFHGSKENKIIIYFEDLANILGAGITTGDSSSFIDYLSPRVELREVYILGEMEALQAQEVYNRDPRLAKLVQEIRMTEPPRSKVLSIIETLIRTEGPKHGVQFSQEALSEIVELTSMYMPYKAFPGKAVEVVLGAISHFGQAHRSQPLKLGSEDIVLSFSEMTGLPAAIVDRKQYLEQTKVRQFFEDRVLGQEEAVNLLSSAIAVFKGRMSDPRKPIRSFLFVGPTGVGKTESAKVLAEYIFGSRDRLVHVNMSEYSDGGNSVSKLIGSHWGDKKTSRFVDLIRSQPFSVVLLDEIEKASGEVRNLLLQVLDEGVLVDGDGKPLRFQSTFIIMTSNIGSRRYTARTIGFGTDSVIQEVQQGVLADIKEFFSPEIFNRFDEVVCFKPLTREVLGTIVNREIGKILERRGAASNSFTTDIDPSVKNYVIETAFDPRYGARHIKRAVEKAVAFPLAELLASEAIDANSQVRIVMADGKPVARHVPEDFREPTTSTALRILRSPAFESPIENKKLNAYLTSAEERVNGLRALMKTEEARAERERLNDQMVSPTFWDDHDKANQALKRFAELTKIGERCSHWDHVLEEVRSTIGATYGRAGREEVIQAKESLVELLKDIESAELEMLLQGKNDSADAFIIIAAEDNSKPALAWLLKLADMYVGWSKRRGYRCMIVGEQPTNRGIGPAMMLHVCGMNAFGLLKNERGTHRSTIVRKVGSRELHGSKQALVRTDCRVYVLADLQNSSEQDHTISLSINKLATTKKGWRLKKLSHRISISDSEAGINLEFLSDGALERDKELPLDLFLSYRYCHNNIRPTAGAQERQLGSLVRTYESGDRNRVLDHASKAIVHDVESFLEGNIDAVLLERLV